MRHRILAFFAAVLLLAGLLTGCGSKKPEPPIKPSKALYVTDLADILSDSTEQRIVKQVQSLKEQCGAEIAVVTVDFLPRGMDSEEFAYSLINGWGVGDKDRNNGVVLVLVPGEGKGWVTAGYGIDYELTAAKLEHILDVYLWDDFDAGEYDLAVSRTVDALIHWFENYYTISVNANGALQPVEPSFGGGSSSAAEIDWNRIVVIVVLILFILAWNSGPSHPRRPRRKTNFYFVPPIHYGGYTHNPRPPHYGGSSFGGGHSSSGFGGGHSGGFHGGSFGGGGGRGGGAGRR